MLDEGCVHILATDAHDVDRRPPNLSQGRELASKRVGNNEAEHLVVTRPRGVLRNELPSNLPPLKQPLCPSEMMYDPDIQGDSDHVAEKRRSPPDRSLLFAASLAGCANSSINGQTVLPFEHAQRPKDSRHPSPRHSSSPRALA